MKTGAVCLLLGLLVACSVPASVLGGALRKLKQAGDDNGTPGVAANATGNATANATAATSAAAPGANGTCLTPSDKPGYTCMMTPPALDAMSVHWVLGPVSDDDLAEDAPTPGEGEISILLEGATTGWLSLAYATTELAMNPADAVLGYVEDDGTVVVKAYKVVTKSISAADEDPSMELTNIKGMEAEGVTTIEFTRALDAGQFPIDPTAGPIRTNAAHGADGEDGLIYHAGNRAAFTTDKMTGEVA